MVPAPPTPPSQQDPGLVALFAESPDGRSYDQQVTDLLAALDAAAARTRARQRALAQRRAARRAGRGPVNGLSGAATAPA